MKQNNIEPAVYTDSVEVQMSSRAEIDLYNELTAFEGLTPDEQAQLAIQPEIEAAEENPPKEIAQSGECEYEPVETVFGTSTTDEAAASESEMDSDAKSDFDESSEADDAVSHVVVKSSCPLEDLDDGIEFTGALSSGVCLGCGAESSTDDLFCPACGVFIEDMT